MPKISLNGLMMLFRKVFTNEYKGEAGESQVTRIKRTQLYCHFAHRQRIVACN